MTNNPEGKTLLPVFASYKIGITGDFEALKAAAEQLLPPIKEEPVTKIEAKIDEEAPIARDRKAS